MLRDLGGGRGGSGDDSNRNRINSKYNGPERERSLVCLKKKNKTKQGNLCGFNEEREGSEMQL